MRIRWARFKADVSDGEKCILGGVTYVVLSDVIECLLEGGYQEAAAKLSEVLEVGR